MKKNMGAIDKTIRVLMALTFIVLFLADVIEGTLGIVLIVLSVVFLLTSFMGFCPLYAPCGISTCKTKNVDT